MGLNVLNYVLCKNNCGGGSSISSAELNELKQQLNQETQQVEEIKNEINNIKTELTTQKESYCEVG